MAKIYVWLRYSAIRQLTWQRNYNTQPRILGEAQKRLSNKIAEAYAQTTGTAQEWVRAMLTTVGRGGNAQAVRMTDNAAWFHFTCIVAPVETHGTRDKWPWDWRLAANEARLAAHCCAEPASCHPLQVRDEILNIMHRNHVKEVKGTWMEEWHQKLHNNTTPDDIPICEAYLAFLRADGDIGAYWNVLSDAGGSQGQHRPCLH